MKRTMSKTRKYLAALAVLAAGSIFYGSLPAHAGGIELDKVDIVFKRNHDDADTGRHMSPPPPPPPHHGPRGHVPPPPPHGAGNRRGFAPKPHMHRPPEPPHHGPRRHIPPPPPHRW